MTRYICGDPEINNIDEAFSTLEDYLKKDKGEYITSKPSGFFKKLKYYCQKIKANIEDFFNPSVVYITGDFIGHNALKELNQYALKLSKQKGIGLRKAYDSVLWDESVNGFYTKIFQKLDDISKKYNVRVAFILGNHDQRYSDFKKSFESAKKQRNWKRLYFVDRRVVKIGGVFGHIVGGFGGSDEIPVNSHPELSNASEYVESNSDALEEFLKNVENYKDISVLLFHKFYETPSEKFLYGTKPNAVPSPLTKNNEKLLTTLKEKGLLSSNRVYIGCGHWHNGGLFKKKDKKDIIVINPGSDKLVKIKGPFNNVLKVATQSNEIINLPGFSEAAA